MTNRLRKYTALGHRQKLVLVQAWCMLGWYRAAILLVSFKRLVSTFQHCPLAVPPPSLAADRRDEAVMIGYLVAAASRYTPWRSLCLVQVLVAQRMLAARAIHGQFYLGVRRSGDGTPDSVGIAAHAWLQCGDAVVNGAAGHEQFTVVSTFRW